MTHERLRMWVFSVVSAALAAALFSACSEGGGSVPSRAVSAPASAMVGESIAWSVELEAGEQFRASIYDDSNRVVFHQDYQDGESLEWTAFVPGLYLIQAEIADDEGLSARGEALVEVMPRGGPTVSGTSHPLVALYTFEIPEGLQSSVTYTCASCPPEVSARTFETPRVEGTGGEVGVLVPGLRPSSTYRMQHSVYDGPTVVERGPELTHTSGAIPVTLAQVSVMSPPINPGLNSLLALSPTSDRSMIIDEQGTPVWYTNAGSIYRPTGNGWAVNTLPNGIATVDYTGQWTRRISRAAVNRQLRAMGFPESINLHHEIRPLPGNRMAIFGLREQLLTDVQGPGELDVIGDTVLVLDDRMQVVWTWDAFEHLDVARTARLNDVAEDGVLGIELELADVANDWTHSNSIDYDPRDGNLLVSVRHQDWVIKIAYEDGTGDGRIIWRLGNEGDFEIVSDDPYPWFSYQHDANLLPDGRLAVYDNGNVRVTNNGGGNSRGQVYILDEENRIATLDVNVDLGVYSPFLGSAARTPDGGYHFNSGAIAVHDTVAPDGFLHSSYATSGFVYRSFRMRDPFDTSPN